METVVIIILIAAFVALVTVVIIAVIKALKQNNIESMALAAIPSLQKEAADISENIADQNMYICNYCGNALNYDAIKNGNCPCCGANLKDVSEKAEIKAEDIRQYISLLQELSSSVTGFAGRHYGVSNDKFLQCFWLYFKMLLISSTTCMDNAIFTNQIFITCDACGAHVDVNKTMTCPDCGHEFGNDKEITDMISAAKNNIISCMPEAEYTAMRQIYRERLEKWFQTNRIIKDTDDEGNIGYFYQGTGYTNENLTDSVLQVAKPTPPPGLVLMMAVLPEKEREKVNIWIHSMNDGPIGVRANSFIF